MTIIAQGRSQNTITTKYLGPTNTRPARIKASSDGGVALTFSYDHALDGRQNHEAAACALADTFFPVDAFGGQTELLRCETLDDSGYLFISLPHAYK